MVRATVPVHCLLLCITSASVKKLSAESVAAVGQSDRKAQGRAAARGGQEYSSEIEAAAPARSGDLWLRRPQLRDCRLSE